MKKIFSRTCPMPFLITDFGIFLAIFSKNFLEYREYFRKFFEKKSKNTAKYGVKKGIGQVLILAVLILFSNQSSAEVIGTGKDEKNFGEWRLICENDVMIDVPYCKIASKFFSDQAVISLEPSLKMSNQMIMVIPNLKLAETVQMRVDKNDIIFSNPAKKDDFGLVNLTSKQKSALLLQMKKGDFLFIRFNIKGSEKEVTVQLNLKDFRDAVTFYNSKISK